MHQSAYLIAAGILLTLAGCPLGTPNDHYRPHGHQDMTIRVSPTNESLVFNASGRGGRDLYLLRLSDMSVVRIAETPDYEVTPTFSPDGASIAYAAGVPGDKADHIFTIRVDGTGRKQLTNARANDTAPTYSADGSRIAFARDKTYAWGGSAANWEEGGVICVVNSDGTNERQLTPDDVTAYSPQFSADGQDVFFTTETGLFSVPVAGDGAAIRIGVARRQAVITADDESIIFADGQYSPDYEIFVSKPDGTEKRQLTNSVSGCFHPVISRTGTRVFFLMEQWPHGPSGHPKSSIWSVGLQDGKQIQVTDSLLFDNPMIWHPQRSP
jgi:Tol biopolymer transport system component